MSWGQRVNVTVLLSKDRDVLHPPLLRCKVGLGFGRETHP